MLHNVEKQDCYVQHLMNMPQRFGITISEDVRNLQGAVLVPRGGQFDKGMAEKIGRHQLKQPLEHCVQLNNQLMAKQLNGYFKKIFLIYPDLAMMNERWQLKELLLSSCEYFQTFPIIIQKITVLKERLPYIFKQSLFCAYMSLALAKRMGGTKEDCNAAFLAGMIHDIGLLHLDADLLMQQGEYTSQQWRAMHSHTVIAHHVLSQVKNFPENISLAVLEHHERFDGSGYPHAKHDSQLGRMGQIVGMADTCLALYKRELAPKKLGLDALLPALQLNPGIFCREIFKATVELISDVPWPEKRVYRDTEIPTVIRRLMQDNERIQHDYTIIYSLVTSIRPHLPHNRKAVMLNNMTKRIHKCLLSSGILQSEHNKWIMAIFSENKTEDYVAIERLEIMYNEIKYQIRQLQKLLFLLWDKQQFKHPQLHSLVRKGLWEITQFRKMKPSSHEVEMAE